MINPFINNHMGPPGGDMKAVQVTVFAILSMTAFAAAGQGITDMKPGAGGGPVTGSAGPTGSSGAAPSLERCEKPFGSMAVVEPQDLTQKALLQYNLPSPTGLIRMMIQQSNCFIVVERGVAMQNIMQERRLSQGGQLREGSNMGQGQLMTADFILTPDVVFSQNNAGGIGGVLGIFGPVGAVIGAGLKFKQAQTSMLVADTRSGVQVAAASGAAEKADFGIGGALGGGGGGLGLGAYENTAEGKVVAASFLDNWNQVVRSVRNSPVLARQATTLEKEAGTVTQAAAPAPPPAPAMEKGDVLVPKIAGITVHATPNEKGRVVVTLARNDEVVFMGKEEDGFLNVRTSKGAGWVDKSMMRKN